MIRVIGPPPSSSPHHRIIHHTTPHRKTRPLKCTFVFFERVFRFKSARGLRGSRVGIGWMDTAWRCPAPLLRDVALGQFCNDTNIWYDSFAEGEGAACVHRATSTRTELLPLLHRTLADQFK